MYDTKTHFGLISVILHWYVAAAVLFLLRIFWRVVHGKPRTHDLGGVLKFAAGSVWRLFLLLLVWQMIWGILVEELHWFEVVFFRVRIPLIF